MIEILQSHIVCDKCMTAASTGLTELLASSFNHVLAKFAKEGWVSDDEYDFCSKECQEKFYGDNE